MFAGLFQPPGQQSLLALAMREPGTSVTGGAGGLEGLAREFSPRVQVHHDTLVSLDIDGLGRLLGPPPEIAGQLCRTAAERGLRCHVAVAPTRTAALLLVLARPGVTVVPPGGERAAVATLSLGVLRHVPLEDLADRADGAIDLLRRWGLKTLGDLAGLPSRPLSERLGPPGMVWQRIARGEDWRPLVSSQPEARFEETADLEWPVEGLEPLSFVLARLCEPLAQRLEALDLAAVALHLSFRLATREREAATRDLPLPAPMRDPKVLRTLILLHLESHPLSGGVDRLSLRVDTAPARVTQFSLLSRAKPFPEQLATLLARLSALLGDRAVGAPALVDAHRPGAFAMTRFSGGIEKPAGEREAPPLPGIHAALRRFRVPVPARVLVREGRPARVATDRHGLDGGAIVAAAGPWRASGEWWKAGHDHGAGPERGARSQGRVEGWSRDEWDVELADGPLYRIYRDRSCDRWFVDGIVD